MKNTEKKGFLKKRFNKKLAYDVVKIINELDQKDKIDAFRLLDNKAMVDVFSYLQEKDQVKCFNLLNSDEKKLILNNLETDDLKAFILLIEAENQEEVLKFIDSEKRDKILLLLKYEEELVSSIMTLDYLTININMSIKEATASIIKKVRDQDYLDTIYAVNEENVLIGLIFLKDLIIARENDSLSNLVVTNYKKVTTTTLLKDAITILKDYDYSVLPVVDNQKLVGIITGDDVLDELVEHHRKHFHSIAQVHDFKKEHGVFKRSFKRLPWLLLSVFLNLLIALFISVFEDTINAFYVLAFFQPLILGMSGNIGTQGLSTTILGIHLKEITPGKKTKKHLLKETLVALFNSFLVAIVGFLIVFLSLTLLKSLSPDLTANFNSLLVSLTVMISLFLALFLSALLGVIIPIIFNKLKIDPGIASGPIITTINDLVGLFIYFGLATLILL